MVSVGDDQEFSWLTSTLASDATDGRGVLAEWVRPIQSGRHAVGYAVAVMAPEDDNLAVREVATGGSLSGRILVVGGLATARAACMGDLIANSIAQRGCVAVVTDGLVRDVAALRALSLSVWCRGVTPRASRKEGPAWPGGLAVCAGVPIVDGDLVIADDDGVVVWPHAQIPTLIERAREKLAHDLARSNRIAAGGSLADPTDPASSAS
ncbi:MAG TPA: RraA family protein [Ktedonobacterales bacterium]